MKQRRVMKIQKGKKEDLKSLQKDWYQKLKDEGFDDIELNPNTKEINPDRIGSNKVNSQFIRGHKRRFNGSHEYHLLCQDILDRFKFRHPIHREIFELHTEGKSDNEIFRFLKTKYRYIYKMLRHCPKYSYSISRRIEYTKMVYQRDY